jgi:hypothetical protein
MPKYIRKRPSHQLAGTADATLGRKPSFAARHSSITDFSPPSDVVNPASPPSRTAVAEEVEAMTDGAASTRLRHDFRQISLFPKPCAIVQAQFAIGESHGPNEQEADRVADRIMHMPAPPGGDDTMQSTGVASSKATPTAAPPIVNEVLGLPGEPLDAGARAFFEPRFGHDFSKVRVHDDPAAARSAEAVNANAYTVGSEVVFGTGRYAPASHEGQRLLAHELAHVVQQGASGATASVIQRDRKKTGAAPAKARKFYQYVVDELAAQEADYARQRREQKYEFMVHYRMNYRALKALLPLAEAVDQGRSKDIPKLVDAFIAADTGPPFKALSEELLIELVACLFTLGLDSEGKKLRDNYSKGEQQYDWVKRDVGLYSRNIKIFGTIVDRTAAGADNSTAPAAKAMIEKYLRVLVPLRDEMLSMSAFDREHVAGKPRWEALVGILGRLVSAMANSLQALTDRAANELGSGNADGKATLLLIRELIETKILPALNVTAGDNNIGKIKVVLAPTEISDGKGVIRDAFAKDRTVAVSTYTPEQKSVHNLEASVLDVFSRRNEQVAVMARIYGATSLLRADKPAEKERLDDAAKNAETLKKVVAAGGKLRLDSDDDWRAFVLQKYKDMTGPKAQDKAKALSAVIGLLYDYLGAFTIHARFTDIYDKGEFKDAYFNKPFPRTLSGQLVQDCGVYAMRVAYILSLVRAELGLRFRFIRMPAHVGLIITGDGMPMYIAHNNHFTEFSPEEMTKLKTGWEELNQREAAKAAAAGAKTGAQPTIEDQDQFVGEVSTAHFLGGMVDMPFAMSEVPAPGATEVATQQALWKEYKKIASKDVFGPATQDKKSPGYLFHNRYLAIMEKFREWNNLALVPFWNVDAPAAWEGFRKGLTEKSKTKLPAIELKAALEAYLSWLDGGLKGVNQWLEGIESAERAIGEQLRNDPKLRAKDTRIARADFIVISRPWQESLREYRKQLEHERAHLTVKNDAEFAVAAVIASLKPPFMPVAEKGLAIIE